MRKVIVIAAAFSLLTLPAFAGGHPPAPTNVQGQVQGQAQGQHQSSYNKNSNLNANTNFNKAYGGDGGRGGAGGNATSAPSSAASTSRGGDQSQGQESNVDNRGAGSNSNNYQQSGIPVSSAVAPSFAIGGCQWAVSGGIQFFGTGVSGGGAGMYEFCKSLMKSKHFIDQGNANVAKALECQDSSIRAAYKTAGQPCQEDLPRQVASAAPQAAPFVPVMTRAQCISAANVHTDQNAYKAAVAACPVN